METGLIRVPLTSLRTNDEQVIGSEYTRGRIIYRYVKNISETALVAGGVCLAPGTNSPSGFDTLVVACDAASAKSAVVSMAGGVPMAAIGPSGSATGSFGWVQVAGPYRVNVIFSTTALIPGTLVIPSTAASGIGASAAWESLGAATALRVGARCAVVMEKAAARSSGYGIASAMANIRCL